MTFDDITYYIHHITDSYLLYTIYNIMNIIIIIIIYIISNIIICLTLSTPLHHKTNYNS